MRLILNVDDTEALRYAKTKALRHAGFDVIEAGSGQAALEAAAARHPDLILLDVKLPDMSGLEVCQRIKRDHPGMMVLQVSATFVESGDRVRGLNLGADAYLAEPISADELVANVKALLRLRDAEAEKDALLRQKDVLFKELNHRVKNNLQLISSLLSIQSRRITDPKARAEFVTAQQRIRTIASLHSRLCRDERGFGTVRAEVYLKELSDHLRSLLLAERPRISLVARGDDFTIDIDRATSVGLIINELVSNATKHAFQEGDSGTILVELRHEAETCTLCVADDGRGRESVASAERGVGLKLVNLLTTQLGGTIHQDSIRGIRTTISFPCESKTPPELESSQVTS